MGLDMYLYADKYVSGYDFYGPDAKAKFNAVLEAAGLQDVSTEDSPSATVSVTVAYWRKANAIHNWFVQNVQGGKDECQKSYVEREQIQTLIDTCEQVVEDRTIAQDLLPPQSGFFFGNAEVDDWYMEQAAYTAKRLRELLTEIPEGEVDFYYQSSW